MTPSGRCAREFFDLPLETKRHSPAPSPDYAYGYSPVQGEVLARSLGDSTPPDLKESLNMGPLRLPPVIPPGAEAIMAEPRWPTQPASLRPAWEAYFDAMGELAGRLLSIMAAGLGLPTDQFEPLLEYHSGAMRAINYPELETQPLPGQLRAGAHTDYGTLSILRYDDAPGGLEVMGPDGWAAVPMVPGGFVVNLGDMMARWTNDRWVSTLHRAGLPPTDAGRSTRRQSIVFFHNVALGRRGALPADLPGTRRGTPLRARAGRPPPAQQVRQHRRGGILGLQARFRPGSPRGLSVLRPRPAHVPSREHRQNQHRHPAGDPQSSAAASRARAWRARGSSIIWPSKATAPAPLRWVSV